MRCSCGVCGTYMAHAESMHLGCVCPDCGARCKACLGTNSVISREALRHMKENPALLESLLVEAEPFAPKYNADECGRE